MSREFILNLFFLIAINLLVKPLYTLGVDMQIQNQLGGQVYGLYFALWNFAYLFQIVADLGIQQFIARQNAQNANFFYQYFPSFLKLKAYLSLCFAVVVVAVAWLSGYDAQSMQYLGLIIFCQLLVSAGLFFRANLAGLGLYRWDSVLSVMDKFLMLAFGFGILYLPVFQPLSIDKFVLAQTLAYLLATILGAGLCVYYYKKRLPALPTLPIDTQILKDSLPFAMTVLLMSIYGKSDIILLERLLPTPQAAGTYAFGVRILDMGNIIGGLFCGLLLPMLARLPVQSQATRDLLGVAIRLMMVFCMVFSATVWAFAESISQRLLVEHSPESVQVLRLLTFSLNGFGLVHIWGTFLTAQNRLRQANKLFFGAIIFNMGLNFCLIPAYGVVAAACLAVLTQFGIGLVQWVWVYKLVGFERNMRTILAWIGAICFILTAVWAQTHYQFSLLANVWLDMLVFAGTLGVACLLIGLLPIKGIFVILKTKNSTLQK